MRERWSPGPALTVVGLSIHSPQDPSPLQVAGINTSGIFPGHMADQNDSPKRKNSKKDAPALKEFIKTQLLKHDFCVRSSDRNEAVGPEAGPFLPASRSGFKKILQSLNPSPLEAAWKKLEGALKSSKNETSLYRQLSKFLTLLADKRYLFIPWDNNTVGEDGESFRQDIVVVDAQSQDIDKLLESDFAPSNLPAEFRYRDDGGKVRSRVYYSDILMVGEVKVIKAPTSPQVIFDHATQVLKYLFTISRYQPRHAHHIGFLAYRDGFIIIDYYPDRAFFSDLFRWDDPIAAHRALQDAIADIRRRHFTTNQFASLKRMNHHERSRLQFCLSRDFNVDTDTVYQLFDLDRGDGWHRNAYVAIAVHFQSVNERLNWKVVKHYWHDTRRRFNELEILQHIYRHSNKKLCTAGIIQVDLSESRVLGQDTTPPSAQSKGSHVPRQSVLLVMKTLGQALSSCSSVMQFLKAMYDLVEVDRMIIEDHQVLHRDISWGNVLINATHVDKDQHDDLCDRPFIDAMLSVEEEARKVHVTLCDFDCACILGSSKQPESLTTTTRGEITGTPMFMASILCVCPTATAQNDNVRADPGKACKLVFPQYITGVNERQNEVDQFLDIVKEYEDIMRSDEISPIIEAQNIDHAPIHDAESIFWLIVLFFLRAHPKGYDPTDIASGELNRREQRTKAFKFMSMNEIMMGRDARTIPGIDLLPPQFHPFNQMLLNLSIYFRQPWHSPHFSQRNEIQFHAHNALQAVLLDAIIRLEAEGDIKINPMPLAVDEFPVPQSRSFLLGNDLKRSIPNEGEGEETAKKKRKKSNTKIGNTAITMSNTDNTAAAINNDPEFQSLMFTIECNRRSKLWFMGDQEYVESTFVETPSAGA